MCAASSIQINAGGVFAAAMTAKGTAAISSIQVVADCAEKTRAVIEKIFTPAGRAGADFAPGSIIVGDIVDGDRIIDHVVVGCEGKKSFAINCHGNPLIVEAIMTLLSENGVEPITAEQLLAKQFEKDRSHNTIAAEAKLAQLKAVTLEGVKIIANQVSGGLTEIATGWVAGLDSLVMEDVRTQCRRILAASKPAGLIINGCRVVIAGVPNSGKSTLLNCLCGKDKAIVTDLAGTTRDWIGAACRVGPIYMELIDTAGLDDELSSKNDVDKQSQEKTKELLAGADLVLWVLDGSKKNENTKNICREYTKNAKMLVVFNKSDLGDVLTEKDLDFDFDASVRISAKEGTGIDALAEKIQLVLGVIDFDLKRAVYFTPRQRQLLERLINAKSESQTKAIVQELNPLIIQDS